MTSKQPVAPASPSGLVRVVAWLGGAAFAASLAYCAYFVAVTLQRPAPWAGAGAAVRAALIDTALFTLFAGHHSVMARWRPKSRLTRSVGSELERPLYVWTASLLLALTCAAWQGVPGSLYRTAGLTAWLLRGIEAAGVVLTAVSARVIDPLELAGIRQLDQPQVRAPIQARGPYRWVRHPIYLGWMLIVFAAPHLTMNRLLFALLSSAYLVMAIPWEERSLVRTFGDEYAAYQRMVKWRVVPGVY
jgi:methanethiol S-methyltransferase